MLDTAVGLQRNTYGGYLCGNQNMESERPTITFTYILRQDTELETPEMRTAMLDRNVGRAITFRAQDST